METITKFKAYDGVEFTNSNKCEEYEKQSREVEAIIIQLPQKPELPGGGFENGKGYLQHNEELFMKIRSELLEFAKKFTDHQWIQQSIDKGTDVHASWAGRLIDECGINALRKAWNRIMCVDSSFREWGQPYYANNPGKGKQVALNGPV